MKSISDDEIGRLLQEGLPQTPAAPRDELQLILQKLESRERPFSTFVAFWRNWSQATRWTLGGGAFAAAAIVGWFVMVSPAVQPLNEISSEGMTSAFEMETLETEWALEEMPSVDVGEEYLTVLAVAQKK